MKYVTSIFANPLFGVLLTLACYRLAVKLHKRWRWIPPIVVACLPIAILLMVAHQPYAVYDRGGSFITWCLGPATVALAVPMYRNGLALRSSLPRLALIVFIGVVVAMSTAGVTAWLLGAPYPIIMSTIPKSVTTPIAVEVCRQLHGIPQITIAMVVLAGVFGSAFGPFLLGLFGITENRAVGVAMGTSSHGIGTASLVRRSEMQATVSAWAMAATGVFTSLLGAVLSLFLR
jgi:predicted murein hydrolase (TIGR00659 family)